MDGGRLVAAGFLGLDRGFFDQHDRDVVLDRVDAPARIALESGAIMHRTNGRLTLGADQDFEKRRVDGHAGILTKKSMRV